MKLETFCKHLINSAGWNELVSFIHRNIFRRLRLCVEFNEIIDIDEKS